MRAILFLSICVAILIIAQAAATTWYVDDSVASSGGGTVQDNTISANSVTEYGGGDGAETYRFVPKRVWKDPGDGRFNVPHIALDSSKNVFVADYENKTIHKFDRASGSSERRQSNET